MRVEFNYDPKRKEVKIVSDFFSNIKERFSVRNKAAHFNKFGRFMPQRIYAITPAGYCGVGLVPEIIKYLKTLDIPFDIVFNGDLIKLYNDVHIVVPGPIIKKLNCNFELRDYQTEAIGRALERGYGIIEVATGGGKTFIISNLVYGALQYIDYTKKY